MSGFDDRAPTGNPPRPAFLIGQPDVSEFCTYVGVMHTSRKECVGKDVITDYAVRKGALDLVADSYNR